MKILKFQNNEETNLSKELRNLNSPFLMEIRSSKIKPCRTLSKNKKKNIFVCFYLHFCLFSGKLNILKITLILFI